MYVTLFLSVAHEPRTVRTDEADKLLLASIEDMQDAYSAEFLERMQKLVQQSRLSTNNHLRPPHDMEYYPYVGCKFRWCVCVCGHSTHLKGSLVWLDEDLFLILTSTRKFITPMQKLTSHQIASTFVPRQQR
jgi:hypothetical protein